MSAESTTRPLLSRRLAVALTAALAVLAAAWLALTTAPPPLDGMGRQFFGHWRTRHVGVALALLWLCALLLVASSGRRAVRRFAAVNVALVLAWIAIEAATLAGLVAPERLLGTQPPEQMGGRRMPHVLVTGSAREDLAESWNVDGPTIPFRFFTDRHGFRNEPDRESADVYLLGDSILVGGLLPHADLVSAQLEAESGRAVMSVALVGIGPQEEAELLRASGLPLAGRLVLHFVFEGNDLRDSARARGTRTSETRSFRERTFLNQLVIAVQRWTQPVPAWVPLRTGWIGDVPYRFNWLRNSFEGLEGELEPIAAALAELRRDVEAAGGRYAIVLVPSKIRVLGPLCRYAPDSEIADWESHCGPLPAFLRAWAEREGVACLDLTGPLRESARRGAIPWFQADTHWNATGHRVAAEALLGFPGLGLARREDVGR